mmetsp:Transcript_42053/g.108396  ORF Transcript_42053/g.108396 Transcript_42053/m.108396 type:complete len:85 (-) Transcript_42053:84-338(-)
MRHRYSNVGDLAAVPGLAAAVCERAAADVGTEPAALETGLDDATIDAFGGRLARLARRLCAGPGADWGPEEPEDEVGEDEGGRR